MKREIMMKMEQTVATAHVGVSSREACPVVDDEPAIAIGGRSVETLFSINRKKKSTSQRCLELELGVLRLYK